MLFVTAATGWLTWYIVKMGIIIEHEKITPKNCIKLTWNPQNIKPLGLHNLTHNT